MRKGMTLTLKVVVTVVVILVVAFVVLTIFSGGVDQANKQLMEWFGQVDEPIDLPDFGTGTGGTCSGAGGVCKTTCDPTTETSAGNLNCGTQLCCVPN